MVGYNELLAQVELFSRKGIPTGNIGQSVLGRMIPCVCVGSGFPRILSIGTIHAREYITTELLLRLMQIPLRVGSVWYAPMLNVDGAELCQFGLSTVRDRKAREFLQSVNGSDDFSLWKANSRAVDINVNFPAGWGWGESNVTQPSSESYIGQFPLSEPESQAVARLLKLYKFDAVLCWHSKGEVIYWNFHQEEPRLSRDRRLAHVLAQTTGYTVGSSAGSFGGIKDYCILEHELPSFTIEVGRDDLVHPIQSESLEEIWEKTKNVHSILIEELVKKA